MNILFFIGFAGATIVIATALLYPYFIKLLLATYVQWDAQEIEDDVVQHLNTFNDCTYMVKWQGILKQQAEKVYLLVLDQSYTKVTTRGPTLLRDYVCVLMVPTTRELLAGCVKASSNYRFWTTTKNHDLSVYQIRSILRFRKDLKTLN